jgi:hypothetical protein
MYKIHEILIPIKFCTIILQIILTIVVSFTKVSYNYIQYNSLQ